MSRENVKLFYEALIKDKALQEKFKAVSKKYEGQKRDEAKADLIYQKDLLPLARKAGFDFTLAELKEYAEESKRPVMRELSEEELVAVSGGTCDAYTGTSCPTLPGFAQSCPNSGIRCPDPGTV